MDKSVSEQVADQSEKLFVNDVSVRTFFSLKTERSAIQELLPNSWELTELDAGPAKGSNLSIALIDPVIIQDAQGASIAPQPVFVIATLARRSGSSAPVLMVIGGFAISAPGAYEVYQSAKLTVDRCSQTDAAGQTTLKESWKAETDQKEVFELQAEFVRGSLTRTNFDTKIYSAAKPDFFRIYRGEQLTDVVRSDPLGVDRLQKFSIQAKGPKLAGLFDGARLIGLNSIPMYRRALYLPVH